MEDSLIKNKSKKFYFGFGASVSNPTPWLPSFNQNNLISYSFGVMGMYKITNHLTLETRISYSVRNIRSGGRSPWSQEDVAGFDTYNYSLTLGYVEIPVLIRYNFKDKETSWSFYTGFMPAILVGGKLQYSRNTFTSDSLHILTIVGSETISQRYKFNLSNNKNPHSFSDGTDSSAFSPKYDFSILLGIGKGTKILKQKFYFGVQTQIGLMEIGHEIQCSIANNGCNRWRGYNTFTLLTYIYF